MVRNLLLLAPLSAICVLQQVETVRQVETVADVNSTDNCEDELSAVGGAMEADQGGAVFVVRCYEKCNSYFSYALNNVADLVRSIEHDWAPAVHLNAKGKVKIQKYIEELKAYVPGHPKGLPAMQELFDEDFSEESPMKACDKPGARFDHAKVFTPFIKPFYKFWPTPQRDVPKFFNILRVKHMRSVEWHNLEGENLAGFGYGGSDGDKSFFVIHKDGCDSYTKSAKHLKSAAEVSAYISTHFVAESNHTGTWQFSSAGKTKMLNYLEKLREHKSGQPLPAFPWLSDADVSDFGSCEPQGVIRVKQQARGTQRLNWGLTSHPYNSFGENIAIDDPDAEYELPTSKALAPPSPKVEPKKSGGKRAYVNVGSVLALFSLTIQALCEF